MASISAGFAANIRTLCKIQLTHSDPLTGTTFAQWAYVNDAIYLERRWSIWNLNGVNFFLAQIADVVMPFLTVFLKQHEWSYEQIGSALAITTFGSVVFQIPAGVLCGRTERPRRLLSIWALVLGASYFVLPLFVQSHLAVFSILFVSGIAGTFFAPLLGTLALFIGGTKDLGFIVGRNRSWNHAGNVAAALITLLVLQWTDMGSLFYIAAIAAIVSAWCCMMIRRRDLHYRQNKKDHTPVLSWLVVSDMKKLLQNPQVLVALISVALFHFANGPTSALVALYMKKLGSPDSQIAWIALVSQPIMIPSAWFAGKYCASIGRKPVMSLAFFLLPVRIFLYIFATTPIMVLGITAMDGIIAGIFGVMAVLFSSDLTREQRGFNSLLGLFSTMPAVGAMLGALAQGYLTQHYDFMLTFAFFGTIAVFAALFFSLCMKETKRAGYMLGIKETCGLVTSEG